MCYNCVEDPGPWDAVPIYLSYQGVTIECGATVSRLTHIYLRRDTFVRVTRTRKKEPTYTDN